MLPLVFAAAVFALASPSPSPSPVPSGGPALSTIGQTNAGGRGSNLLGRAPSASSGTIGAEDIAARPVLRPGEVLEAVPGLIISQHSGEGKANQYYLRGFQLDHGTDLAATIAGQPINLPTHAHGQGYSDINWLLPELVSFIEYKKGPYFADEGDFSTAGAYRIYLRNTIESTAQVATGSGGFDRFFVAGSPALGTGRLLYAFEAAHDDGSSKRPDEYRRLNGMLRWSRTSERDDVNITALAYDGKWDSSDQIPQRLVDDGAIDRYGLVDPSDGGRASRTALSGEWTHRGTHRTARLAAYAIASKLDLFSNFTYGVDDATDYYNVTANPVTCDARYATCAPGAGHVSGYTSSCPANVAPPRADGTPPPFAFACGDQREQKDVRIITGADGSLAFDDRRGTTTIGAGVRNDNVPTVGLYLTTARMRDPNRTLSDDHVVERAVHAEISRVQRLSSRLRLTLGLRAQTVRFDVHALDPRDSGVATAGLLLPKAGLAYRASPETEFYLNAGESYHSNDGRGLTQRFDPQTHATVDPSGAPVQNVSPLVRANGEEVGVRFGTRRLTASIALWRLGIASELTFDGDHGTTSAGRPTERKGLEISGLLRGAGGLTYDLAFATSTARYLTDPDRIGTAVPQSLASVASAGITLERNAFGAALRMRYFGPRTLIEDGSAHTHPTTLLNAQLSGRVTPRSRLTLDVFNLLGVREDDTTYYYNSWTPSDAAKPALANDANVNPALGGAGVADYHFHPAPKRTFRLSLTFR